jgi:hypothetical protein
MVKDYGNLTWKLVLEAIIPLSFVLGLLALARLNSPRICSIQLQYQILCGLVCAYLHPLTRSAPSWSSHCVVMAACCCCLWWRWWSDALWATLIRLWLHLLSCYLQIVVLEIFSVISKIWSSSFNSKLEDNQLESWMYMCINHNSLPEVVGGLLYAYLHPPFRADDVSGLVMATAHHCSPWWRWWGCRFVSNSHRVMTALIVILPSDCC